MTSYLNANSAFEVPENHDEETLKGALAEMLKTGMYRPFADLPSVRAATRVMTAEQANSLQAVLTPAQKLEFYRVLPEAVWLEAMQANAWWKDQPIVSTMALVRDVEAARVPMTDFGQVMEFATDDELRAVLVAVTTPAVTTVRISASLAFAKRLLSLASEEQATALWLKASFPYGAFLYAMSDAQLLALPASSGENHRDATARFGLLQRGLYSEARLESDLALIDALPARYPPLDAVFLVATSGEYGDRWPEKERLMAILDAGKHAKPFAARLRAWHEVKRATVTYVPKSVEAMLLLAIVFDDAASVWLTGVCNKNAGQFRNDYEATPFMSALGDAFLAREDGDKLLPGLEKRLKGKSLAAVLTQAKVRLSNNQSECGLVAQASIPWGMTHDTDALRLLIATGRNHFEVAAEGFSTSDPVGTFNAFLTAFTREFQLPEGQRSPIEKGLAFIERALPVLEQSYDESAPDGKALDKLIGGHQNAEKRFRNNAFGRYFQWNVPHAAQVAFVDRVLAPLYTKSTNVVFKRWVEPTVISFRPDLVETSRAKLERITATPSKGAKAKEATTAATLVFRTSEAPSASTVNRLYGAPIGVSEATWPAFEGKPMEHLITLETRAFHEEARGYYEKKNVLAVAVFLSSLNSHEAFAPGSKHAAVVELTATDIAKGASSAASTYPGIALEAVTKDVPESVFQGGAKKGALFELRKLLDQHDFLATYRRSPRWLQEPQGGGLFLFDMSGSIASNVNLGDGGTLYVFADTAFIQSA